MTILIDLNAFLYDYLKDASSFVMPLILKSLPTVHLLLGFGLSFWTLAFLMRIILTWYPQVDLKKSFWLVAFYPTEPFLVQTRKIVQPIGGVDVTPIIWLGLVSLARELVVGQQGVLSLVLLRL